MMTFVEFTAYWPKKSKLLDRQILTPAQNILMTSICANKYSYSRSESYISTHWKAEMVFDNTSVINGVGSSHLNFLNTLPSFNSAVAF